jgi:hypothetical protein
VAQVCVPLDRIEILGDPQDDRGFLLNVAEGSSLPSARSILLGAATRSVPTGAGSPNSVVVQMLEIEPIRGLEVTAGHAARTAFQTSRAVLSLMRSFPSLN